MGWFFQFFSDQKFKDSMDSLLLIDDNVSHYVYIKYFDRIMFHKQNKNKFRFAEVVYSVSVVKVC